MVWGIWTVRPTILMPDESGAMERALRMGMNKTVFIDNFFKGGNLHIHLLQTAFVPYYVYLLLTGRIDEVMAGAAQVSNYVGKAGVNPWNGPEQFVSALYDFLLIGRLVSVLAGIATLYVVYRIGRKLYNIRAGQFAAAILAVSMVFVNTAHFATEDALMTLLVALTLLFVVRYRIDHSSRDLTAAAFVSGLAVSAKATAGTLIFPLVLAYLHRIIRDLELEFAKIGDIVQAAKQGVKYVFLGAIAYLLTTPSVIIYPRIWWQDVVFEIGNRASVYGPEEPGWLVQAGNLVNGLGLPLFILSMAGIGFAIWGVNNTNGLDSPTTYLLLFLGSTYAIIGTWDTTAVWYIVPLVPIFAIFSGNLLTEGLSHERLKKSFILLSVGVLLFSLIYTGGAMHKFESDSRVEASDWIDKNMESGTTVDVYTTHHYLPGFSDDLDVTRLPIFLAQDIDNIETASQRVASGTPEYIVLSRYHYSRYVNNPSAFPRATDFYGKLLNEESGYEIAQTFGPIADPGRSTSAAVKNSMTPQVYYANPRIVILNRTGTFNCKTNERIQTPGIGTVRD